MTDVVEMFDNILNKLLNQN